MFRKMILFSTTLFLAHASFAADQTPKSDAHEKVENIRQTGALKVHEKPQALKQEDDDLPAIVPQTPSAPAASEGAKSNAVPAATSPAARGESSSSNDNLFGVHAQLGVPHPVSLGFDYVLPSRYFSAGVEAGSYSGKASDVRAKIDNVEIALRYHPFAGSFFLGALAGTQKIHAEKDITSSGVTAVAQANVKGNYVTPHLGWMWGLSRPGFFASVELGYQIQSGVTTDVTSDADAIVQATPDYQSTAADVKDQAEKVGKSGFPYVGLFKFGWLF